MTNDGTSNQGSGLDVQRLTFDNLAGIPRRNNILFLSDYLQEQHSYAKMYASEGLTVFSSWNYMASPAPKTSQVEESTDLDAFLLGTPVLKARAPAAPVVEKSSTILKALDSTGGPALIGEDQMSRKCTAENQTRAKKLPTLIAPSAQAELTGRNVDTKNSFGGKEKPKETKKRKDERVGPDEEHLKHLQERRERKRLKKGIMKSPAKESDSEKENPARCTKKGGKKDKTKSPSFALMHGFTATNVGKSRITLEPLLRNVGVFKKGKASCVLKTGKLTAKKRSDHDICFSEAQFLGTAKTKAIRNIESKSSSASSFTSDEVHKTEIIMKRKKNLLVFRKSKGIDKTPGESVEDSNCGDTSHRRESPTPAKDRRSYDPANSITWDIERESYVEESEASSRQGTIVLSFPRDVLVRGGDQEDEQAAIVETPVVRAGGQVSPGNPDATAIKTPNDSLHPSHSASQVVREQPKAQGIWKFSKYFLPENITTKETVGYQDLYEGCQSVTLPVPEPRRENRSMFRVSPPSIEARLTSPTLSQMISLNLDDALPRPYDIFSLADVRSIFEGATMELDDNGAYHGSGPPQEHDFRPRSDNEIAFEPGLHSMQHYMLENPDCNIVSGNDIEHNFDFENPPVDSRGLPDDCCQQDIHMDFAHEGVILSDWPNVGDGRFNADDMAYEPASGNDTFSRVAPSDVPNLSLPSVDGSSEDDNCVSLSPSNIGQFSQGRSLLYGLDHGHTRVSDAETEVAKLLKQNHWLPYRL